jgi:hypothetical protein
VNRICVVWLIIFVFLIFRLPWSLLACGMMHGYREPPTAVWSTCLMKTSQNRWELSS